MRAHDEVILKGKVKNDAKEFFINFPAYPLSTPPTNIAYQFKTNFVTNQIAHNYKTNGHWNDEKVEKHTWISGPVQELVLTFSFGDGEIFVYAGDEYRNYQYAFERKFSIDSIRSIEVWGDVEFIDEITFRYKRGEQN